MKRLTTSLVLAASVIAAPRAAPQERAHGPLVANVSAPFVAEGSVRIERDQRRFVAVVLTTTARLPAGWPLVMHASITLDGDVLKSTFDALRCAPAIDGHVGVLSPMPPMPSPGAVVGDAVSANGGAAPQYPDLHWGGAFAAGPIPAGHHTFTLTCESAAPFELRGVASLRVSGDPSGR